MCSSSIIQQAAKDDNNNNRNVIKFVYLPYIYVRVYEKKAWKSMYAKKKTLDTNKYTHFMLLNI